MIVDVRCSVQYSIAEDVQKGSESAARLQTLQKQRKRVVSQIDIFNSKESLLKDVLVASASSDKFNFSDGLDMYDQKKLEITVKREELQDELAEIDRQIQEIGIHAPSQVTRSISPSYFHTLTSRNCKGEFGGGIRLRGFSYHYHKYSP